MEKGKQTEGRYAMSNNGYGAYAGLSEEVAYRLGSEFYYLKQQNVRRANRLSVVPYEKL